MVSFGASEATGDAGVQLKPLSAGLSTTVTLCSVTLPVFFAVRVNVTTWPTWSYFAGFRLSVFVRVSAAFGVVTSEQTWSAPAGPSSTHAVFRYEPASMSAWTIVCDAVQLI